MGDEIEMRSVMGNDEIETRSIMGNDEIERVMRLAMGNNSANEIGFGRISLQW